MKKSVLIVGAGIAGMSAAISMKKAGWEPTLVERTPEQRPGGYFVGLFPVGKDAAKELGVFEQIHFRTPRGTRTWDLLKDGSRMRSAGFLDQPGDIEGVMRGDLAIGLWGAIKDWVDIRFSTSVSQIVDDGSKVQVTLKNLESGAEDEVSFDLVIGADGLRSATRKLVFGPDEKFMKPLNAMICAYELDEQPPNFDVRDGLMACEVNRALWVFPLSDKAPTALFTYRTEDIDAQFQRPHSETLREVYGDMPNFSIIEPILNQLDDERVRLFDSVNQIHMPSWSKGRVVMLGDAAWCLTLYSGMGASTAMKGAVELGKELSKPAVSVDVALSQWEVCMRPLIKKCLRKARFNEEVFVPSTGLRSYGRRMLLRYGSKRLLKASGEEIAA